MNDDTLEQLDWILNYNQYIELVKKGLRKQAQTTSQIFIRDFQQQSKIQRRRFIDILCKRVYETGDYSLYLPYHLSEEICKNAIPDWIKDEPHNSIPYKWSGELELMKKSLAINSFDQETLFYCLVRSL